MMRGIAALVGMLMIATPAIAAAYPPRTIQVMGTGRVSTPPGRATIHLFLAGEGRTPDAASAALEAKQAGISAALSGFLQGHATFTNSNLVLIEARDPKCDGNGTPRMSDGICAVVGYVATIEDDVTTDRVDKAGTAASLAGRLGARDARISGYALADEAAAYKAAIGDAVTRAQAQAALLAAASGARLGPALTVRDQNSFFGGGNVVAEDLGRLPSAPPAPPPPPPPIDITVKPAPIETQASVYITYALLP